MKYENRNNKKTHQGKWFHFISAMILMMAIIMILGNTSVYSSAKEEGNAHKADVEIKLSSEAVNLNYHILSHFDIGDNDATIYNPEYIEEIRIEKEQLGIKDDTFLEKIDRLSSFYKDNFDKLVRFVEWTPYVSQTVSEYIAVLKEMAVQNPTLSTEERNFLIDYAAILGDEFDSFYKDYLINQEKNIKERVGMFKKLWTKYGQRQLDPLAEKSNVRKYVIQLSLSFQPNRSMVGRDLGVQRDKAIVLIGLPKEQETAVGYLMSATHDLIITFSGNILVELGYDIRNQSPQENSAGYEKFLLLESSSLYLQYFIIKTVYPEHLSLLVPYLDGFHISNCEEFKKLQLETKTTSLLHEEEIESWLKRYNENKEEALIEIFENGYFLPQNVFEKIKDFAGE